MNAVWLVLIGWCSVVGVALLFFWRDLSAVWREPVMRYPVLIIESDDWGAGPIEAQVAALERLLETLARFRDERGRHPVMTLSLILAVPDGPAIRRQGRYCRLSMDDPKFVPLREVLERGRAAGVFAMQLHGLEHYWPAALMAVDDSQVRAWLTAEAPQATERLPSHLQSRWVDASVLPSTPLEREAIRTAVAEEVQLFKSVFGDVPRVAVPPTFVWNVEVERSWAEQGVEFVVTPGLRSACRDATGLPNCDSGPFLSGEAGKGVTYLVRDDYFEPERGHRAEQALSALARKASEGRACLLETHRSNFIGDPAVEEKARAEITRLLEEALLRNSELRFISTEELGLAIRHKDPEWIEFRFLPRWNAWRARIRHITGFWRLARVTGLVWLLEIARKPARV